MQFLDAIVSCRSIETDPDKKKVLKEFPVSKSIKKLRNFIVFSDYFRRFIKECTQIAKPPNDMLTMISTNRIGRQPKDSLCSLRAPKRRQLLIL